MLSPEDLLNHSNRAYQQNVSHEVWARAGVSRVYYACFHFCRKAADSWCSTLSATATSGMGTHQRLILRLKTCAKKDAVKSQLISLADILGKALDERVNADYHLERSVGRLQYQKALKFGNEIKKKVEEIEVVFTADVDV